MNRTGAYCAPREAFEDEKCSEKARIIVAVASRPAGRAGPTDAELTTEEKVGTIAIVGLALAGAEGVAVVFND